MNIKNGLSKLAPAIAPAIIISFVIIAFSWALIDLYKAAKFNDSCISSCGEKATYIGKTANNKCLCEPHNYTVVNPN